MTHSKIKNTILYGLATLAATFCATSRGVAAAPSPTADYLLRFGTDPFLLRSPDDPMAQKIATWKNSQEIEALRNAPIIRLSNQSPNATNGLTNFQIELTDPNFVFDEVLVLDAPNGVGFNIIRPANNGPGGPTNSILEIAFTNGSLEPGQTFVFSLDIDAAAGAPQVVPDFRHVFWDLNGNNRDDNAIVRATFEDGVALEHRLYEYPFANTTIDTRPTDGARGSVKIAQGMQQHGDELGVFEFDPINMPIPEPSSLVLGLIGCLALLSGNRQGRRRRSSR